VNEWGYGKLGSLAPYGPALDPNDLGLGPLIFFRAEKRVLQLMFLYCH